MVSAALTQSQALMLAELSTPAALALTAVAVVVGAGLGILVQRLLSGRAVKQAQDEADRILRAAEQEARTAAEATRLEAEREAIARKERIEKELDAERSELRETERRLTKRDELLHRKEESAADREAKAKAAEDDAARRERAVAEREIELKQLLAEQTDKLHEISGHSKEQALARVLERVEEENRREVAKAVRHIVEDAEAEAKTKATEITLQAIQRFAAESTSEATVRSVAIPSDDMKGRIIGREGRNIRAFEKVTGADIIVDDTPGVIVVSCFDKVRQAVAVEALERLVADGRMHPSRIEDVVSKVKSEIEEKVRTYGKETAVEVNLRGLHPKINEAMGKLHYRTSYGQNVLRHSVEVAYMSQIIAEQLGLDGKLARRCGYLHDIGKAMDHEMEGGHPKIGMDFAKQYGEKEEAVLNAIGGHHADIPSTTFYTPIVMAADAVSSARPGARRESMERYIQRLNDLQDIALAYPGVEEAYAVQAGREVRVMIDAAKVSDDEAFLIAHEISKRVSDEMTFPGEIKVTVLRETRAVEYAR
ncbi:MAG: ribonuclease Y [Planctomycetota bacterium]